MPADRTHSSTVETDPAHAASVALPPRVLSAFLAVEIAARERPALVVMDLNLPEMNGYDRSLTCGGYPRSRRCRLWF